MARKAILETGYTFTPSTNTVVIPRAIPRERLILITNVTTNTVIYNFSDNNLRATSYTIATSSAGVTTTTLVLNYSTASMSSTDKLQIIVDEYEEKFLPAEIVTDPVNKFRVSEPQALIDTDFEYGTQITKWENLAMINNRPFVFSSPVGIATINYISLPTNSRTVSVGLQAAAPGVGTAITVQDTYLSIANGNFIVETVTGSGNTIFTYTSRASNTTSINQLLDSNKTGIFSGSTYTNAAIGGTPTFGWTSGTAIPVTTTVPHGLAIGNEVAIVGSSQVNANGSYVVARINSNTQFTYYSTTAPAANPTGGRIFVRPQGQFLHRPFDGGVIFSSNANANFETAIRQTRRYFRYQSGKGIQVSSGTILKPNLQLDSLTSIGTTVTVQTKEQHNIQPGTVITVSGANESGYNGTFTINNITGYNTFQYTASTVPTATPASGSYNASVSSWYGCVNRLGIFDSQNGLFFEFDGQQLYAVRRSSTFQLSGKVTATSGINTISQTNASFPTYFSKQLDIGDFVVIRGQSYRVVDIASDTSMTISPSYRGASSDYVIMSKTTETRIPQSQWNIDKCDGTGPSGYNIDLTKMQMFYIDYSWYGAGFIRWGLRGEDGNVFYVHKMKNNNVNNEAYMRSGNLPARYESSTLPPTTRVDESLSSTDTTMTVLDTSAFPSSGTLIIRPSTTDNQAGLLQEYVNYTGKTATTFTGLTRGGAGATAVATTWTTGSNSGIVSDATGLQVGQRVFSSTSPSPAPDGAFITNIAGTVVTLNTAITSSNPTLIFAPMGATAQTYTHVDTAPTSVELAYPSFAPSISHWGTSVIMDGRFDDDASLIFTYGQTGTVSIPANGSKALFSIRLAPSVDNGISANFGQREIINRMQLKMNSLGVTTTSASTNYLVRAYLNAVPSASVAWTTPNFAETGTANSSLAQIADYRTNGNVTVSGGEITGGFLSQGTDSIELSRLRDLGNCVLGGGGTTSNSGIYPDGPDTLTIVVTNLSSSTASFSGRLAWTEAQA